MIKTYAYVNTCLSCLVALVLAGCSSRAHLTPDPDVFYRRDARIETKDKSCFGTCVLPRKDKYKIKVRVDRADVVRIASCHRETQLMDEGSSFKYTYKPDTTIEQGPSCPLKIETFDFKRERHYYGFIDFEHPDYTLPAKTRCNGFKDNTNGVSVCQGKVGFVQKITFPVKVRLFEESNCSLGSPWKEGKNFKFKVQQSGHCVFLFEEFKKKPRRRHRLTVIGYESILIPREDRK